MIQLDWPLAFAVGYVILVAGVVIGFWLCSLFTAGKNASRGHEKYR